MHVTFPGSCVAMLERCSRQADPGPLVGERALAAEVDRMAALTRKARARLRGRAMARPVAGVVR